MEKFGLELSRPPSRSRDAHCLLPPTQQDVLLRGADDGVIHRPVGLVSLERFQPYCVKQLRGEVSRASDEEGFLLVEADPVDLRRAKRVTEGVALMGLELSCRGSRDEVW